MPIEWISLSPLTHKVSLRSLSLPLCSLNIYENAPNRKWKWLFWLLSVPTKQKIKPINVMLFPSPFLFLSLLSFFFSLSLSLCVVFLLFFLEGGISPINPHPCSFFRAQTHTQTHKYTFSYHIFFLAMSLRFSCRG